MFDIAAVCCVIISSYDTWYHGDVLPRYHPNIMSW